jgi:hypothetical protein
VTDGSLFQQGRELLPIGTTSMSEYHHAWDARMLCRDPTWMTNAGWTVTEQVGNGDGTQRD